MKPTPRPPSGIRLEHAGVSLAFQAQVSAGASADALYTIHPKFTQWAPGCPDIDPRHESLCAHWESESLRLTQEVYPPEPDGSRMRVRLRVENTGKKRCFIHSIAPVCIPRERLQLGVHESPQWRIFSAESCCCIPSSSCLWENIDSPRPAAKELISGQLTLLLGAEEARENLLLGFITSADQHAQCRVSLTAQGEFNGLTVAGICHCYLAPGEALCGEWVELAIGPDPYALIERYAREKAERYRARKASRAPAVYSLPYGKDIADTQQKCLQSLTELARRPLPFDAIEVGGGWGNGAKNGQADSIFPVELQAIAKHISRVGLIPGIATSPLLVPQETQVAAQNPSWFLSDGKGGYPGVSVGGIACRILDITHPQAAQWCIAQYRQLRKWGYRHHRLNLTRATLTDDAIRRFDMSQPLVSVYREFVASLRSAVGEDAYLAVSGGVCDPLIGLIDAYGTDDAAKSPLRGIDLLRYWMRRWWDEMPPSLTIDRPADREKLKSTLLAQYACGGVVRIADSLEAMEDDRLYLLRHILPVVNTQCVPRDLFRAAPSPLLMDVEVSQKGFHTVALFNLSKDAQVPIRLSLDEHLVGDFARAHRQFWVCEFFSGAVLGPITYGDPIELGYISPGSAALIKIAPFADQPVVIASTAHFSMGGELERLEIQDGTLFFDANHPYRHPVEYTLRLPKKWHAPRMPEYVGSFFGDLRISLPGAGKYSIEIPLKFDI